MVEETFLRRWFDQVCVEKEGVGRSPGLRKNRSRERMLGLWAGGNGEVWASELPTETVLSSPPKARPREFSGLRLGPDFLPDPRERPVGSHDPFPPAAAVLLARPSHTWWPAVLGGGKRNSRGKMNLSQLARVWVAQKCWSHWPPSLQQSPWAHSLPREPSLLCA